MLLLQNFILNDDARSKLDEIAALIAEDDLVRSLIRTGFKAFLKRCGKSLKSYEITRLFAGPSSVSYEHMVYLYDFVVSAEARELIKQSGNEAIHSDFVKIVRAIRNRFQNSDLGNLNILNQLTQIMDMETYVEKVPESYYGQYIGYRRSANRNHIVRFTFDIMRTDDERMVEYENDYIRPDIRWNAIGFGVSVKNTLYLIGHARHTRDVESLGLRFLAIKEYGTKGALTGLLISMDMEEKIIAARIVLIPREMHQFGKEYQDLDEDSFASKIIHGSLLDEEILREEISSHLDRLSTGIGRERLFELIRHHAFSGLKIIPSEFDDEIGRLEGKIEDFAKRTGTPPRDVFKAALKRFVDEIINSASPL